MSDIRVKANRLAGRIVLPPFKSEAIRLFLLYALSGVAPKSVGRTDDSFLYTLDASCRTAADTDGLCDDVRYALDAASALLCGSPSHNDMPVNVGGSATLLRLMIPPMAALYGFGRFRADGSLLSRNLGPYFDCFGRSAVRRDGGILEFTGRLEPFTEYKVDASESSQFASGMLLALPLVEGMRLRIVGSPVSEPYFLLTLRMLNAFGIRIGRDGGAYIAETNRFCAPSVYRLEPDLSYAANFLAAAYMVPDCSIELAGLSQGSGQADAAAPSLFGLDELSVSGCPDLFPILCIAACAKRTPTVLHGIGRLRGKESDRVGAMQYNISSLGGRMDVCGERAVIFGSGSLRGGHALSFGDHRIIMACAIASLICSEPVIIHGWEAVGKSAPNFFNDFRQLGGIADEYIR